MKTLRMMILCGVTSTVLLADEGPLPSPEGGSARYQVVPLTVNNGGQMLPTLARLDTWTGKVWILRPLTYQINGKPHDTQVWLPTNEKGGDLHRLVTESFFQK